MFGPQDIDSYEPQGMEVMARNGDYLRIFSPEVNSSVGAAVALHMDDETTYFAVVTNRIGNREIEAWLPACPDEVIQGTRVSFPAAQAGFVPPWEGHFQIDSTFFRPAQEGDLLAIPEAPAMSDLAGKLSPVTTGLKPLDLLSPVAAGGITLLLEVAPTDSSDASTDLATDWLLHRCAEELDPDLIVSLGEKPFLFADKPGWHLPAEHQDLFANLRALQVLAALGPALRRRKHTFVVVDLPAIPQFEHLQEKPAQVQAGLAEIVDLLGRQLASTKEASITLLLRLVLHEDHQDLAAIIETLRLGDVDAQIFVDSQHRYIASRSTSRAELSEAEILKRQEILTTLTIADRAEEKAAIFGDDDLTVEEKEALASRAQLLEASLLGTHQEGSFNSD